MFDLHRLLRYFLYRWQNAALSAVKQKFYRIKNSSFFTT
ncbi:hypothetical protein CRENPOLYSF1_270038 [Crenothrix polyspora]|uniref:Uncharacterized protein n=1 Tax=Crenothrix polyspora TaxID=360316 RepID=A0A1R4H7R2_9GAMM|nr:hypothetical protein CRENPOLYSF1_270038 [Crenothrix polyspora]